ncbi:MAG: hypothetical protein R3D71_10745 [Rickettsiales bacterium]
MPKQVIQEQTPAPVEEIDVSALPTNPNFNRNHRTHTSDPDYKEAELRGKYPPYRDAAKMAEKPDFNEYPEHVRQEVMATMQKIKAHDEKCDDVLQHAVDSNVPEWQRGGTGFAITNAAKAVTIFDPTGLSRMAVNIAGAAQTGMVARDAYQGSHECRDAEHEILNTPAVPSLMGNTKMSGR